jgi:predicted kinase
MTRVPARKGPGHQGGHRRPAPGRAAESGGPACKCVEQFTHGPSHDGYGEIGAGKTTYSKRLEHEGFVRLSLDEWTIAAVGDPVHVTPELVTRMIDQLMRLWPQIVRAGADVVLDFAFWERARRDHVRQAALSLGAGVTLVHIRCDIAERRERCTRRTENDSGSYLIDHGGFDWITNHRPVDPLGHDEPHSVIDTSSSSTDP